MRENKSDSVNPLGVVGNTGITLRTVRFTISPRRNCHANQFTVCNQWAPNVSNTNARLSSFCTNNMVIIEVRYQFMFIGYTFLFVNCIEFCVLQIMWKYVFIYTSIAHCSGIHTNCSWIGGQLNRFYIIRKFDTRWKFDERNITKKMRKEMENKNLVLIECVLIFDHTQNFNLVGLENMTQVSITYWINFLSLVYDGWM